MRLYELMAFEAAKATSKSLGVFGTKLNVWQVLGLSRTGLYLNSTHYEAYKGYSMTRAVRDWAMLCGGSTR